MRRLAIGAILLAIPAFAQVSYPPSASRGDIEALAAQIPAPAQIAPPAEITGGTKGTMIGTYALANHSHPRITDSPSLATVSGGTFAGTFRPGLFASKPTVALTWVTTGTVTPVSCEMRSITSASFSGRCTTLLGLVAAPAGIEVDVVALPNTGN